MAMADDDRLQSLISEIYDSALEPARWSATLANLADAFGGNAVAISDKDFRINHPTFIIQTGFCAEIVKLYTEHYIKEDIRFAVGQHMPSGSITHEPMFITEAEMDRSAYYQEFLAPFDFRYHAGGVLENSGDIVAAITLQRSPRAGTFTDEDLKRFSLLLPHFQKALLIQRRLESLQRREKMLIEVIDRLPTGVMVLNAQSKPVLMNRAAEAIIAEGEGLRSGPDGVVACRSAENAALRKLLAEALTPTVGRGAANGFSLQLSRAPGKKPLLVWAVPSGTALTLELALAGPHVLLFVTDPERRRQVTLAPALIEFYGLRADPERC